MKAGHKITLEIPDELFAEIADFKKKAHISDAKTAVFRLLEYALTLPPYFKDFNRQKAEEQADTEIN